MYERIPTILTPTELLNKALGRATKIVKDDPESFYRVRKTTQARLESITDVLHETLQGYVKTFPNLDRIATYERELFEIVIGVRGLQRALSRVDGSSETIRTLGHRALGDTRGAKTRDALLDTKRRFIGRASSVVRELEAPLQFLARAREIFHALPEITPGDPTIVVAGYPNVGKSSLLAKLSRARPDIAPYPFTTKQANVGHFHWPERDPLHARRYQVVDTPGLLDRPARERSKIEQQAALALSYLADVVLFVLDPSEACGYTLEDQEKLLESVRREFPSLPLLVVENKVDLKKRRTEQLQVSTVTGDGLGELKRALVALVPPDRYEDLLPTPDTLESPES